MRHLYPKLLVIAIFGVNIVGGCTASGPTGIHYASEPLRQQLTYPSGVSSQQCLDQSARTAFAYEVLQTQLMEVALTCDQRDAYNAFVRRHRPALLDANRQIAEFFARLDGSDGQQQRDAYVTELANAQAQGHGPEFCQSIAPMVAQALTLSTSAEVTRFVAENRLTDPYASACTETSNLSMKQERQP